jgi:hypothetical protein
MHALPVLLLAFICLILPSWSQVLYGCGDNGLHQLGVRAIGSFPNLLTLQIGPPITIFGGKEHTVYRTQNGQVFKFGNNDVMPQNSNILVRGRRPNPYVRTLYPRTTELRCWLLPWYLRLSKWICICNWIQWGKTLFLIRSKVNSALVILRMPLPQISSSCLGFHFETRFVDYTTPF